MYTASNLVFIHNFYTLQIKSEARCFRHQWSNATFNQESTTTYKVFCGSSVASSRDYNLKFLCYCQVLPLVQDIYSSNESLCLLLLVLQVMLIVIFFLFQIIFFPDHWWHATLNLDAAVFMSTFFGWIFVTTHCLKHLPCKWLCHCYCLIFQLNSFYFILLMVG